MSKLLMTLIFLATSSFAQDRLIERIESMSLNLYDNVRSAELDRDQLMQINSLLSQANRILGSSPTPPDRTQISGVCIIDDDSNVDAENLGTIYANGQAELLELCQMIANNVYGTTAYSKITNTTLVNSPVMGVKGTCVIDDDSNVDATSVNVVAKSTRDMVIACQEIAKKSYRAQAHSLIKSLSIVGERFELLEASCTIDDDSNVDAERVGNVFGRTLLELVDVCHTQAENRYGNAAYSILNNVTISK